MNSRDAAYEESLQELLDATAAEAVPESANANDEVAETVADASTGSKKKRKRRE